MNLIYPMFITGLLTSFHCVMMCGNMVLSYAIKDDAEGSLADRMRPHIAYHLMKILSYTVVGLALGSVGSFISAEARSWVSTIAGGYMVLLGLSLTGRFPILRYLEPRPPRFFISLIAKMRRKAAEDEESDGGLATPMGFGLITGLMPCGPLIAAQVAAAGSGSAVTGATMMLAFGLGTAPLMLGYGAVASYLGKQFKRYMSIAAAILIVVLGLVMINRGATALGSPVNYAIIKQAVIGSAGVEVDESKFKPGPDGVIEVPLEMKGYVFKPSILAIPADKPVRIVVNRKDANLCSDQLWIPSLKVKAKLTPNGQTKIDLPPTKAGAYQMTCQMGMLSSTLQVGSAPGRSSILLVVLGITVTAGIGGTFLYTRSRRRKISAERESRRASAGRPFEDEPNTAGTPAPAFRRKRKQSRSARPE